MQLSEKKFFEIVVQMNYMKEVITIFILVILMKTVEIYIFVVRKHLLNDYHYRKRVCTKIFHSTSLFRLL